MHFLLILLFALILVEVPLFLLVGTRLGQPFAWLSLLGTGLLGLWILYRELLHRSEWLGSSPEDMGDFLFRFLSRTTAAVLLILPGFATDIIGLALLVPPFQNLLGRALWKSLKKTGIFEEEAHGSFWRLFSRSGVGKGAQQRSRRNSKPPEKRAWKDKYPTTTAKIRDVEFELSNHEEEGSS